MPDHSSHERLRDLLYGRFRLQPQPLLAGERFIIPGATLWTGARVWVKAFRELGLRPGDRVAVRLARTPSFVMVTIACWWEGLTLCPLPESMSPGEVESAIDELDARLVISSDSFGYALGTDAAGAPADASKIVPREGGVSSEGIALIMSTSGTSGRVKRVALTVDNLLAQLESHTEALGVTPADRVLSVLPWHHAFGLLVDLWPALLGGGTVYVEPGGGRDPRAVLAAIEEVDATRLSMVPLLAERLLSLPEAFTRVRSLQGVIGGAPVEASLAQRLRGSSLRVGYGQTEASPGICLGAPGDFSSGWIGEPVGCETRLEAGELLVRGPNVCAGLWDRGVHRVSDADGWLATGDLVAPSGDGYAFVGRLDDRFKLSNGRMIEAPTLERAISAELSGLAVMVGSVDAKRLTVVVIVAGDSSDESMVGSDAVRGAMGPVGGLLDRVVVLTDAPELRLPKGTLDRRAILRALREMRERDLLAA